MMLADLDRSALIALRTRGHPRGAERLVAAYSGLGEHAACWLALGLGGALLDSARRDRWRRGVAVIVVADGLNYALKLIVRRPRPRLPGLPPLAGVVSALSLPSAHATTAFAAARAYRGLAPAGVLYGAAAAFALSRPYLGVHYPSDVMLGAMLGTAVAMLWPSDRGLDALAPRVGTGPGTGTDR